MLIDPFPRKDFVADDDCSKVHCPASIFPVSVTDRTPPQAAQRFKTKVNIRQCRQRWRQQPDERNMRQQGHDKAQQQQWHGLLPAQFTPLGIRGVHRQRIVGKGATVQPGHPEQRQDQPEARNQP